MEEKGPFRGLSQWENHLKEEAASATRPVPCWKSISVVWDKVFPARKILEHDFVAAKRNPKCTKPNSLQILKMNINLTVV